MITQVQQAEIARILGYPNLSPQSSLQAHYPTFSSQYAMWQPYAVLLNRLAGASSYDEVQYMGAESALFSQFFTPAALQLTISTPSGIAAGATVQIALAGKTLTYNAVAGDTPATVASKLMAAVIASPDISQQFLANATGANLSLYYIAQIGTDGNGVSCIATSTDASLLLSCGAAAAQLATGQTAGGTVPPGPQYTPTDSTETVFGYVPIIHTLESDFINSRTNLDTLAAGKEWKPRQDELSVRYALLRQYRKELADRIGVPLDPDLVGNGQQIGQRVV